MVVGDEGAELQPTFGLNILPDPNVKQDKNVFQTLNLNLRVYAECQWWLRYLDCEYKFESAR